MTVKELINALLKTPFDAVVWTEGCDCIGEAATVEVEENGTVLIGRKQ